MTKFLKRIKETERIIRQENEFIDKIRKFKPKIQLEPSVKTQQKIEVDKRIRKKAKSNSPTCILRTGIVLPIKYQY